MSMIQPTPIILMTKSTQLRDNYKQRTSSLNLILANKVKNYFSGTTLGTQNSQKVRHFIKSPQARQVLASPTFVQRDHQWVDIDLLTIFNTHSLMYMLMKMNSLWRWWGLIIRHFKVKRYTELLYTMTEWEYY